MPASLTDGAAIADRDDNEGASEAIISSEIRPSGRIVLSDRVKAIAMGKDPDTWKPGSDDTESNDDGDTDVADRATDGPHTSSQLDDDEVVESPGEGAGAEPQEERETGADDDLKAEADWRTDAIRRRADRYGIDESRLSALGSRAAFDALTDILDQHREVDAAAAQAYDTSDEDAGEDDSDDDVQFSLPEPIDVERFKTAGYEQEVLDMVETLNQMPAAFQQIVDQNKSLATQVKQMRSAIEQSQADERDQQIAAINHEFNETRAELGLNVSGEELNALTTATGMAARLLAEQGKQPDMREAVQMAARMLGKEYKAPGDKKAPAANNGRAERVKEQSSRRRPSPSVPHRVGSKADEPRDPDELRELGKQQALKAWHDRKRRAGEA